MTTLLTTLFNKKRGKTKKIGQIIKYDKNPTFWLKIGILSTFHLAGGERFELSTNGFGDIIKAFIHGHFKTFDNTLTTLFTKI